MTTADRADTAPKNQGHRPSEPPLLHLRGTSYGLLIHGLRMAAEGRPEAAHVTGSVLPVDGDLSM